MDTPDEKFSTLRTAIYFLKRLESQIEGILGVGEEYQGTWGQEERRRKCLDAVKRLRRQIAQLSAEIALGNLSDYQSPKPFARKPRRKSK